MVNRAGPGIRRGTSRLGCVIQLAILVALIYVGMRAVPDLLDYYRLRDAMKQEARFATRRTDTQIKDHLRSFADSVGLPAEAQEVNIVRDENTIHIWTEYDQPLDLPFDIKKSVHLRPSVEEHI
jgi:hypothetical protein